ncbi:MAG: hypothetical protein FD189_2216 [Elusimicrobia bacterium]|nr:MAG: hypothetical protein FD154_2229 [Elusimicrobiota bacterium]KAF0153866.1 MAG: hypothetical protein FD189_2216 [Elusimicrobiota bacterium]
MKPGSSSLLFVFLLLPAVSSCGAERPAAVPEAPARQETVAVSTLTFARTLEKLEAGTAVFIDNRPPEKVHWYRGGFTEWSRLYARKPGVKPAPEKKGGFKEKT